MAKHSVQRTTLGRTKRQIVVRDCQRWENHSVLWIFIHVFRCLFTILQFTRTPHCNCCSVDKSGGFASVRADFNAKKNALDVISIEKATKKKTLKTFFFSTNRYSREAFSRKHVVIFSSVRVLLSYFCVRFFFAFVFLCGVVVAAAHWNCDPAVRCRGRKGERNNHSENWWQKSTIDSFLRQKILDTEILCQQNFVSFLSANIHAKCMWLNRKAIVE